MFDLSLESVAAQRRNEMLAAAENHRCVRALQPAIPLRRRMARLAAALRLAAAQTDYDRSPGMISVDAQVRQ